MGRFWPIGCAFLLSFALVPIPWGDSVGSILGPISFLCEGDWDFDEFPFLYEARPRGPLLPDAVRTVHPGPAGDRLLSFTGMGGKLVGLPAAAIGTLPWWTETTENAALRANLVTGLLCTALSLFFFFRACALRVGERWARWATLALFFGTTLWPQTRQSLWSNEAALPGLMAMLWLMLRARGEGLRPGLALGIGAAMGWAVLARVSMLLLCGPLLVALLWEHRGALREAAGPRNLVLPLVAGGLPFALLLLWDNALHTGSAWTPTFAVVAGEIGARLGQGQGAFSGNVGLGFLGLLFSPSRGLLVFSPLVLLALPGLRRGLTEREPWVVAGALGVLLVLGLNASYADWWGASCWGPRRLMELCPLLLLLGLDPRWEGGPAPRWLRQAGPPLLALSVAVQAIGFLVYDSRWDAQHEPTAILRASAEEGLSYVGHEEATRALWSVKDGVLVDALARLPQEGVAWGWQAEFSLSPGRVLPAPMPRCAVLQTVDRFGGDGH